MSKKSKKVIPEKEALEMVQPKKKFFSRDVKISFFLFALCFLIYGNGIRNGFSLDDEFVLFHNQEIEQGIKAIPEIFTSHYAENLQQNYAYRPIVKVSYAIEYQLFGENPHIGHFINVLLYAFTCIFLFYLLKKLFKDKHFILPLLATTLFLVHPLHTEVVDSLKNRDALLSCFGSLIALYLFIKYAETTKIKYAFFGSIAFILAYWSKPDAMTFLAIIPLTLYFFTDTSPKKIVRIIGIIFVTLILIHIGSKLLLRGNHINRTFIFIENPLYVNRGTLFSRILLGFFTLAYYYKLLFFPIYLSCYYGYNTIPILHPDYLIVIISALVTLSIAGFAVYKIKTKKIIFFGILYFFITSSMFLNVVVPAVGIVAERFMYIPSIGFCIVLAVLILELFKIPYREIIQKINFSGHKKFLAFIFILLTLCSCRVIVRNPNWRTHFSIYKHDINNVPESSKLHALLASMYLSMMYDKSSSYSDMGKNEFANKVVVNYQDAIRIYPDYVTSLNNLGMAYYAFFKHYKDAIPLFERALVLDSTYVEAYYNLAFCKQASGDLAAAEKYYLKSISIRPDFLKSYTNLTLIYISEKRYDDAINLNQNPIIAGYQSSNFYINIGNVYMARKDPTSGIMWFKKGLEVDSNNEDIKKYLANYYQKK